MQMLVMNDHIPKNTISAEGNSEAKLSTVEVRRRGYRMKGSKLGQKSWFVGANRVMITMSLFSCKAICNYLTINTF